LSNIRDAADRLLEEMRAQTGLSVELDAAGEATLQRGDGREVAMVLNETGAAFDLLAPLDVEFDSADAGQMGWMLERNLLDDVADGAVFAVDLAAGLVVLRRRAGLAELAETGLAAAVAAHMEAADAAEEAIAERTAGGEGATAGPRANDPAKPIRFA